MGRSDLLDLLPDFSGSGPRPRSPAPREPGFEPLVQEAFTRDEFATLDMPVGFPGLAGVDGFADDPFADSGAPQLEILGEVTDDLPDFGVGELPDLDADLQDLPLSGDDLPALDSLASGEDDGALGEPASFDEIESEAEGVPAHELLEAAHAAEIERLEAAHHLAFESLVSSSLPRMKQEVVDALAAELAPLVAPRIRSGVVAEVVAALSAEIAAVLDDSDAVSFELRGPERLLLAFEQQWSGDIARLKMVPDAGIDLVARVDRSVIATRLSEFDRLLAEAVS